MAISHVASVSNIMSPAATSMSLTKPTGTAELDLIVIVFAQSEDEDGNINIPSGFTEELGNSPTGGSPVSWPALSIFTKIAGSAEPSSYTVSVTNSANTGGAGLISTYRGIQRSDYIDVAPTVATSASTSNPDPPSISVNTLGAYCIIGAIRDGVNTGTLVLPTGYTSPVGGGRRTNGAGGNGLEFYFAHKLLTATGTEDPAAFQSGGAASPSMAFTLAIKPAARRIYIS